MAKSKNGTNITVKQEEENRDHASLGAAINDFVKHRANLFDSFMDWRFPDFSRRWQELSRIRDWTPAIDVSTGDKQIVIKADLPGVKKEDIGITVGGGFLTVSGERKEGQEKKGKDYYFSERSEGSFYRSVRIPDTVDANAIQASYTDGVLTVTVPTPRKEGAKKVNVVVK